MQFGRRLGAFFLALHMLFITLTAHAQTQSPTQAPAPSGASTGWTGAGGADVIYLKDGQQIRGTLMEMRVGQSVTMQLPQGQNATVQWEGIAGIERNGQAVPLDAKAWQPQTATPGPAPAPEVRGSAATDLQPVTTPPDTMRYDEEQPVPAGYHVESKPRLGLLITGAVLSGIGLFGIVAIEASTGTRREDKNVFDVLLGLVFLGPGLPLLLVGLLSPKKQLRRDSAQALWNSPLPDKQPFYVGFGPAKNGGGLLTIGRQF